MSANRVLESIHVGLFSEQPMRLEGLASIFDLPTPAGKAPMYPVKGRLDDLLACHPLDFLIVDLPREAA